MLVSVVGLGKMGLNLALNLKNNNYKLRAYDKDSEARRLAREQGIDSYDSMSTMLEGSRENIIFLMIPSGPIIDRVIDQLRPDLKEGDIIVDAGNSNYKDSMRRYEDLRQEGIGFLDCGTSGGPSGALEGACTMVGGDRAVFERCENIFRDISVEEGYLYTGQSGSGHFAKMVHNGIEYGMMQSIAEGFELLSKSDFDFSYKDIARLWNHGSVIRSWLMELTEEAFSKDANLDKIKGVMHSSGEGKWTVETALEQEVATPVIALALMMRYRSLEEDTFSGRIIAALRNEFGGHDVVEK